LILAGVSISSGALLMLLQAIEKIQNWRLNREKLKLEVEKLRMEGEKLRLELEQKVKEREAFYILDPLVRRFEDIPLKLADIEIRLKEENKDKFAFR